MTQADKDALTASLSAAYGSLTLTYAPGLRAAMIAIAAIPVEPVQEFPGQAGWLSPGEPPDPELPVMVQHDRGVTIGFYSLATTKWFDISAGPSRRLFGVTGWQPIRYPNPGVATRAIPLQIDTIPLDRGSAG